MSTFIPRFRELLANSTKQQKDICNDLGISQQKLSKWKTGYSEPNFDDLVMLASYFNVTTGYLLGQEDDFGYISFTKEEKAFGLNPNHAVVLSDDDRYRIHLLAQAEETLGKAYVDGVLKMIELSIQQKK